MQLITSSMELLCVLCFMVVLSRQENQLMFVFRYARHNFMMKFMTVTEFFLSNAVILIAYVILIVLSLRSQVLSKLWQLCKTEILNMHEFSLIKHLQKKYELRFFLFKQS